MRGVGRSLGVGIPFPSTKVIDNFVGTPGANDLNLSEITGAGTFNRIKYDASGTGGVRTGSAFAFCYWNVASYAADCEAYVTVTASPIDTIRVGGRIINEGTANYSGYVAQCSQAGVWTVMRIDNGAASTIATGSTQAMAVGDKIGFKAVGNQVLGYWWNSANGTWNLMVTATDGTYTAGGRLCVEMRIQTIDDFGGGTTLNVHEQLGSQAAIGPNRMSRDQRIGRVAVGNAPDADAHRGFGPLPPMVIGAPIAYRGPEVLRNRSRIVTDVRRIGTVSRTRHLGNEFGAFYPIVVGPPLYPGSPTWMQVRVTLARNKPQPTAKRLSPPVVVDPFVPQPTDDQLRIRTKLVQNKPQPTSKTLRRPTAVFPVPATTLVYAGLRVYLTRGQTRPARSRLSPPAVVAPAVTAIFSGPATALAYSRRGRPKSILRPPRVIAGARAFSGPRVYLTFQPRRPVPKPRLTPPAVVTQAGFFTGPVVHLVRGRAGLPKSKLPIVVYDARVYAPVKVTLAPPRRGRTRSRLSLPVIIPPTAKAEYDLRTTLAYQSRGKPKSFLREVVYPARVYAPIKTALAYSRRGRPSSRLSPPSEAPQLKAEIGIRVTLAPQRRGVSKSRLLGVIYPGKSYEPIRTTLAPQRRGKPKSRLTKVIYPARVYAPISVTLAYQTRGKPKSTLRPPPLLPDEVINRTHWLAPSSRGVPKSRLSPPAVILIPQIGRPIATKLVQIRPVPTAHFLRPPTVVDEPELVHYVIRVTLARIRPFPTTRRLSLPAEVINTCYGYVSGSDSAAVVAGSDSGVTVTGSDSGATATGSDSAATVTGATGSEGTVSGGDERREGC